MLDPGSPCVLRYRYADGGLQAVLPMRVVDDRPDRTMAWLAPGTEVLYWATLEGADPRTVPLAERFRHRLSTAPRTWQGNGALHVMRPGGRSQVLHFWRSDGSFAHWYVNFEAPLQRCDAEFESVDHHLDLVVRADRTWEWEDEDEADAAVEAGVLDTRDVAAARAEGRALIEVLVRWPDPQDDFRTFRAPAHWSPPLLPSAPGNASCRSCHVSGAKPWQERQLRPQGRAGRGARGPAGQAPSRACAARARSVRLRCSATMRRSGAGASPCAASHPRAAAARDSSASGRGYRPFASSSAIT